MISVVIPVYKRRDCVLRLLGDLSRQEHPAFEVIVVDDASRDGTVEAIAEHFPSTVILTQETTAGPAVARNRGIRRARGELIVGLDSDVTIPHADTLQKVAAFFEEIPGASALAFRLLKPDGLQDDTARWWHPAPVRRFAARRFLTCYFSGTAYAVRKKVAIDAGLFPEIYFMHYEEVELALRILDRGGRIIYCPEILAIHHADPVSRRNEVSVYYKPRNQLLLAAGCFPLERAVCYLVPRMIYQLGKAILRGHPRAFARAMRDAAAALPRRLRDRHPLRRDLYEDIAWMRGGIAPGIPREFFAQRAGQFL